MPRKTSLPKSVSSKSGATARAVPCRARPASVERSGLILLVVLGMLALFSLLAVTYVVFSGQSRSASVALARSEIRGHKSHKGLMEEAIKSLIRGPRKLSSPMRNHDLLGDLYGAAESSGQTLLQIRNTATTDRDRPLIFGRSLDSSQPTNGHFLRIPLDNTSSLLPTQTDVLNGRVITFRDGSGPLSGKSFHIVRYIGEPDLATYGTGTPPTIPQEILDQRYSITIDLREGDLNSSYSASVAGIPTTGSVMEWVLGQVPLNATPGFHACYLNAGTGSQVGYQIMLNAAPLNSHGIGVLNDGSSQFHVVWGQGVAPPNRTGTAQPQQEPMQVAVALQPNHPGLMETSGDTASLATALNAVLLAGGNGYPGRVLTRPVQTGAYLQNLAANNNPYIAAPQIVGILGDTDEPYDAADMNDMWASYRESGAANSFQIIPSFHRPALINYLVNWHEDPTNPLGRRPQDPRTWTIRDLIVTLYRVHLASLRPLSYQIRVPHPNGNAGQFLSMQSNPKFSGGNTGSLYSNPTLVLDPLNVNTVNINQPMAGDWPTVGWPAFEAWLNSLTLGPWDVDNDLDGVAESVFVDPGLPLETSKEGKLLKALVAYYVDDLDSKIDINAAGNLAQPREDDTAPATPIYPGTAAYQATLNNNSFAENGNSAYLYQGRGVGPAEISFRHMLGSAAIYQNILEARYGTRASAAEGYPGVGSANDTPGGIYTAYLNPATDDAASLIHSRGNERLVVAPNSNWPNLAGLGNQRVVAQAFRHGSLPGLPVSPIGRASYGLDRLGNPMVWTSMLQFSNGNPAPDSWNDPYESSYQDSPFTLAEWERIYRHADTDRTLPNRLFDLIGFNNLQMNQSQIRHMITAHSSHLRVPNLTMRSRGPNEPFFGVDGNPLRGTTAPPLSQRSGYFDGNPTVNFADTVNHRFDGRSVGVNSFYMLVDSIYRLKFDSAGAPGVGVHGSAWYLKTAGVVPAGPPNSFFLANSMPYNAFRHLFPLEFHRGTTMNLNRPFGNRIDDDNDGNVDESDELVAGQFAFDAANPGAVAIQNGNNGTLNIGEDYAQGGRIDTLDQVVGSENFGLDNPALTIAPTYRGVETRQLFARHLYCLAQLLIPEDYVFPSVNRDYFLELLKRRNSSQADRMEFARVRGRILAQWAINVVDFRDADFDMTRFPYDPDPFRDSNGVFLNPQTSAAEYWDVVAYDNGGNAIGTNVVWGLEQPELLFSESFATHDLRVRVQENDPMDPMDDEVEQYRKPEGSLFLELFCPRSTALGASSGTNTMAAGVSPSMYTTNTNGIALNVGSVAPANAAGDSLPVFRVVISEPHDLSSGATLPTPNERILATGLTDGDALPHDLTHQFPDPNSTGSEHSGLVYDFTALRDGGVSGEALNPPDSSAARVIHFAADGTYTKAATPGIDSPDAQVFDNRNGNNTATNQLTLNGGQYLVVGPRLQTYFGTRANAETADPNGGPANQPNPHGILFERPDPMASGPPLAPNQFDWVQMDVTDPSGARMEIDQRQSMRDCVTMVAATDSPLAGWSVGTWGMDDTNPLIGVSVSEPLLNAYYREPSERLNSGNTDADTAGVDASNMVGFANLYEDAYFDYDGGATNSNPENPFDDGSSGPLQDWTLGALTIGSDQVVQPGTQPDFCTAYLQRLAYPEKGYDPVFNPYITVDWMPIDLTVFSGEDDDSQLDPPAAGSAGAIRFATRQRVGQTLNAQTLEYDPTANVGSGRGAVGETFLSALTTLPAETTPNTASNAIFQHVLAGDESTMNTMLGVLVPADDMIRPTTADGEDYNGNPSPATLGFLNSTFRIFGENTNMTAVPSAFVGAPSDPQQSLGNWRPDALFWANRDFVSSIEMMWVPTSSPGQLMQEFSGQLSVNASDSIYAAAFRQDDTSSAGLLRDPRTPAAPVSPGSPGQDGNSNNAPNTDFAFEGVAYTPYVHLLNFFQEVPELQQINLNPAVDISGTTTDRNSKSTSLLTLLDWVETPSPWSSSVRVESPAKVARKGLNNGTFRDVNNAETIILAPFRAPNNELPTYTEPGRVNLNLVSEPNVVFGLAANLFDPNTRTNPINRLNVGWQLFNDSRRGYELPSGYVAPQTESDAFYRAFRVNTLPNPSAGAARGYDPNSFLTSALGLPELTTYADPTNANGAGSMFFNPHYPTRFGMPFRPGMQAGMVPVTRNPFPLPTTTTSQEQREQLRLHQLADKKGVLDLYARKSGAHATLLRGTPSNRLIDATFTPFDDYDPINGGTATNPTSAGVYRQSGKPLYVDATHWTSGQRNAMTDFSFVTRLKNMTTERSNTFAVYMTLAFFEYDEATGIGQEYGSDRGEAQRYRSFYIIDRSKPVGYQSGVDHNVEDTILLRRYLKTDD